MSTQFGFHPRMSGSKFFAPVKRKPTPPIIPEPEPEEKKDDRRMVWEDGFAVGFKAGLLGLPFEPEEGLETRRMTMRQICKEVAEKHGLTMTEMRSRRRLRLLVVARQEAMWRCRQETLNSLPQIGAFLGGLDHTTVLHGARVHVKRVEAADLALVVAEEARKG